MRWALLAGGLCSWSLGCATASSPPMEAPTLEAAPVEDAAAEPEGARSEAVAEPAGAAPEAAEETAVDLPEACADTGEVCTPPAAFVQKLCANAHPDVALAMFRKGTPWTRAYVRGRMEAWYVAEGARSTPRKLRFGEEVIVVANRTGGPSGVRVSGSGSYDVFRWDGTCVSVMEGEVALHPVTTPDVATIPWRRLEPSVRTALKEDEKIAWRYQQRRKACKKGRDKCDAANLELSRMVAHFIRAGGEIPTIKRMP